MIRVQIKCIKQKVFHKVKISDIGYKSSFFRIPRIKCLILSYYDSKICTTVLLIIKPIYEVI